MSKLTATAESTAWTMVGLAAILVLLFFTLHVASGAPVVGAPATWVGQHASGSAYGF